MHEYIYQCCNGWRMACKHYCFIVSLIHSGDLSHIFSIPGLALKQHDDNNEKLGHNPTPLSFDTYKWALSVTVTRQNEIPVTNLPTPNANASAPKTTTPTSSLALIPVWDMCNHSSLKCSSQAFVAAPSGGDGGGGGGEMKSKGALECTAHVAYKKGDEVPRKRKQLYVCVCVFFFFFFFTYLSYCLFLDTWNFCTITLTFFFLSPMWQVHIFYGKRTNSEYFLYSGFVPQNNQEYDGYSNYLTWSLTSDNIFGPSSELIQKVDSKSVNSSSTSSELDSSELLKSRAMLCQRLGLKMSKDSKKEMSWNVHVPLSRWMSSSSSSSIQEQHPTTAVQVKKDLKYLFLSSINPLDTGEDSTKHANEDIDAATATRLSNDDYKQLLLALMASTCSQRDARRWLDAMEKLELMQTLVVKKTPPSAGASSNDGEDAALLKEDEIHQYFVGCMRILKQAYENQLKSIKMTQKMIELKKLKLLKELKTLLGAARSGGGGSGSDDSTNKDDELKQINDKYQRRLRHLSIANDLIGADMALINAASGIVDSFLA
jgi:hypothetical protein